MRHRIILNLFLATALLVVLLPALTVAGPPPQPTNVHPRVWETLRSQGEADVLVVLRTQADLSGARALPTKEAKGRYVYETLWQVAEATQRGLRAALDARGVDYQPFYLVNAIKLRAGTDLIRSLAARADVDRFVLNPWHKGIPSRLSTPSRSPGATPSGIGDNIARVHAPDVWALGYTGQGIVVAGQDTGYDWDHPALKNQYRGWDGTAADHNYNWHDAIHEDNPNTFPGNLCGFDSPVPCDDHGHGTHTMGTIVGDDGDTHQIGMAPGARWISCRNMEDGWGTPATYIECFEFFLAPYPLGGTPAEGDPDRAPHVVSNSWGCPSWEGCDEEATALLQQSIQALRDAGIVVVTSAGNDGPGCSTVHDPPAIYRQSFSVGGFNHRDDSLYYSSSRGPVTYGGDTYTKPDISAPAVSVTSSLRGGGYGPMTGTSMAAPHVAGAVALLLSAAPIYAGDVDAIQALLTGTTEPRTTTQGCGGDGPADVPNNVWGWGMLDAHAAAQAGLLRGAVTDAGSGNPIAGVRVTVDLASAPKVTTDPAGQYNLALPTDVYTVTADAIGYTPQTITNVVVISREITIQHITLAPALRLYLPLVVKGS